MKTIYLVFPEGSSGNPRIEDAIRNHLGAKGITATLISGSVGDIPIDVDLVVTLSPQDTQGYTGPIVDGASLRTGVGNQPVLYEITKKITGA
ncbi:hypothetical protein G7062_07925 [Erysipelothrix sp. HDW6C]|uniref:hypothetical protein n=1 Tax=Erysipelothrix sp. HDW6C TaxID=2714930 RepID=UPI001407A492|nr:hypothetical protein [Erysipelothrix sp. HDW6C]QIK70221.1 hypothetical protein G7062_07925 [Erysipelothrix sp. HDW6C]